ncbi:hypothetical protein KKF81_06065 [Candidatus Micrarchaeota archaeon]|nr:hypothetical protein [Candidatus Micrarchaeota archaeon]MBU1166494.1 hypothetical protein [Candidatus Micrarchaeota archaeon]MBU1887209.1 hypothetical protein [Candidatus Micrarchaeota archaeon]
MKGCELVHRDINSEQLTRPRAKGKFKLNKGYFRSRITAFCAILMISASVPASVFPSCPPLTSTYLQTAYSRRPKGFTTSGLRAERGETSCVLDGDTLSCSNNSLKASIILDTRAEQAISLHCSGAFSVILTEHSFIVTIGPEGLLSGQLGLVGLANSYRLAFPVGVGAGDITELTVDGQILRFDANDKPARLDLSNPRRWEER